MKRAEAQIKAARALVALGTVYVLLWCPHALALDPSLDISQYAHRAWTDRDGLLPGAVYAITQTPDGYLWLGTQSGVVRFDGVRAVPLPLPFGRAVSWGRRECFVRFAAEAPHVMAKTEASASQWHPCMWIATAACG